MGNSVGSSGFLQNDTEKTYPLSESTKVPRNTNLTIIYEKTTPEYVDKLIESLPALNTTNEYTIIIHNINTTTKISNSRFSKIIWQTPDPIINTTALTTPTYTEDGTILILSTCIDASTTNKENGIILQRFTQDTDMPVIFLPNKDLGTEQFHDGFFNQDYTNLSIPQKDNKWMSKILKIKLFNEDDEMLQMLSIDFLTYQIYNTFSEMNSYFLIQNETNAGHIIKNMRSLITRTKTALILILEDCNKYTMEIVLKFLDYFATKYGMKHSHTPDKKIYILNATVMSNVVTFQNIKLDLEKNTQNFYLDPTKKMINCKSKLYGIINQKNFYIDGPDVAIVKGVQVLSYKQDDIKLSTSIHYDLFFGAITPDIDYFVTLFAHTGPLDKKIIIRLRESPDPILLQFIKDNVNLNLIKTAHNIYLTNLLNYTEAQSIFADSYYRLGFELKQPADGDIYDALINKEEIKLLRKTGKYETKDNPFINTPKFERKWYYITKPFCKIPDSLKEKTTNYVLTSNNTTQDLLLDFCKIALYKENLRNWCFISTTAITFKDPGLTVKQTDTKHINIIHPKVLDQNLSFAYSDNNLEIVTQEHGYGPITQYISIDKDIESGKIAALFYNTTKAPEEDEDVITDVTSGLLYKLPMNMNISKLDDEDFIGGPLGKLIFQINKRVITQPEIRNETFLSTYKDRWFYSITYGVEKNFIQQYIDLIDTFYDSNPNLNIVIVMGFEIDPKHDYKSNNGKIYEGQDNHTKYIVYIPSTEKSSHNKIEIKGFYTILFNDKLCENIDLKDEYPPNTIILPEFKRNKKLQVLKYNIGPVTEMHITSEQIFTPIGIHKLGIHCIAAAKNREITRYLAPTIDDPDSKVVTYAYHTYDRIWSILLKLKESNTLSKLNTRQFVLIIHISQFTPKIYSPGMIHFLRKEFPDLKCSIFSHNLFIITNMNIVVNEHKKTIMIDQMTFEVTYSLKPPLKDNTVNLQLINGIFTPYDTSMKIQYSVYNFTKLSQIHLNSLADQFIFIQSDFINPFTLITCIIPSITLSEALNIDALQILFYKTLKIKNIVIIARVKDNVNYKAYTTSKIFEGIFISASDNYEILHTSKDFKSEKIHFITLREKHTDHNYKIAIWSQNTTNGDIHDIEYNSTKYDFILNKETGSNYNHNLKLLHNNQTALFQDLFSLRNEGTSMPVLSNYLNSNKKQIATLRSLPPLKNLTNTPSIICIIINARDKNDIIFKEVLAFCTQLKQIIKKCHAILIGFKNDNQTIVEIPIKNFHMSINGMTFKKEDILKYKDIFVYPLLQTYPNYIKLSSTIQYVNVGGIKEATIPHEIKYNNNEFKSTTNILNQELLKFGNIDFHCTQFNKT